MALLDGSLAALGLWTSLERYYQRIVNLILHSGPYEWDSRRDDCSPTGSLTRGSFVSYVVHSNYGCPKPFGF
jgi:hypothetical protein